MGKNKSNRLVKSTLLFGYVWVNHKCEADVFRTRGRQGSRYFEILKKVDIYRTRRCEGSLNVNNVFSSQHTSTSQHTQQQEADERRDPEHNNKREFA
jgi:hypothetical protein